MSTPNSNFDEAWTTYANGEFCSSDLLTSNELIFCQCSAPVNIAVIKYWGKRDEKRILPTNSSLSATLHQKDLKTYTLVLASPKFESDRMWLNTKEEDLSTSDRLTTCLAEVRRLAGDKYQNYKLHIWSVNNFPTAAGLASSASGLACFVYTIAQLFGIKEEFEGQLSTIARQGSGSACRSLYGGFVKWERGVREDGTDSKAIQVAPESHWPNMRILVCVVSDQKKDVSSTSGMQTTVETSTLFKERLNVVPQRMQEMEKAILEKDFESFGKITMQDSNSFHSVCLDTYPPIFYLNDTSRKIIHLIHKWNKAQGRIMAAYTFDAGPNAVIYTLEENMSDLSKLLLTYFPLPETSDAASNRYAEYEQPMKEYSAKSSLDVSSLGITMQPQTGALRYILTQPGPGPIIEKLKN
eukprot:GEZU01014703.1.p1 GENE.GEZU01014703.1~~GEZU01014703.1.p1  ORF type:complete len:411 (+),score=141.74 GEZU01014703.1:86-1318(+)